MLIKGRSNVVPDAIVLQAMTRNRYRPGREIAVEGLTTGPGVHPVFLISFQSVTEIDSFRNHKAECGGVDLNIAGERSRLLSRRDEDGE